MYQKESKQYKKHGYHYNLLSNYTTTYLVESCLRFLSFQHIIRTNMTMMRTTANTIAIISTGSIPEKVISG